MKALALRRELGKALAKRAKSGPLLGRILGRPFFKEAVNELKCKALDVAEFYRDFEMQLENDETKEVEIYCPFTSKQRWKEIKPKLKNAIDKGVKMAVYTTSTENFIYIRNKRRKEFHQEVIDWLKEKGVEVFEFKFMHQKGVFLDNRLAYVGSLNVLSFSPRGKETTDIMLRFEVPQVVKAIKVAFQAMLGENESGVLTKGFYGVYWTVKPSKIVSNLPETPKKPIEWLKRVYRALSLFPK